MQSQSPAIIRVAHKVMNLKKCTFSFFTCFLKIFDVFFCVGIRRRPTPAQSQVLLDSTICMVETLGEYLGLIIFWKVQALLKPCPQVVAVVLVEGQVVVVAVVVKINRFPAAAPSTIYHLSIIIISNHITSSPPTSSHPTTQPTILDPI